MFRHLRVKPRVEKAAPEPGGISLEQLEQDPSRPITLWQINGLPENAKRRVYRALLPPELLARFDIEPTTWKGPDGDQHVRLKADPKSGAVHISAKKTADAPDAFVTVELADNAFNGIDLNLLLLNDPAGERYRTDYDEADRPTLFGKARRNLAEEERAMRAGLAPAQLRAGLGGSRAVLDQLEALLAILGHRAYFLEPLTYASAWVFERRGFAYVRGHKLMDDIHKEFQPGGRLHAALDGSTPFRQADQWRAVRGRAWAIQDGILAAIDAEWDGLRMVKQIGRQAGVETSPDATY
jgi:hypothetical protein